MSEASALEDHADEVILPIIALRDGFNGAVINITKPLNLYVRTDGSDENGGYENNSQNAFKTGTRAYQEALRYTVSAGGQVIINLGSGVLAPIQCVGRVAGTSVNNPVILRGNGASSTFVQKQPPAVPANACIYAVGSIIQVEQFKIGGNGIGNGVVSVDDAIVLLGEGMDMGQIQPSGGAHFRASSARGGIYLYSPYTISGGATRHMVVWGPGSFIEGGSASVTITVPVTFGIFAESGGGGYLYNYDTTYVNKASVIGQRFYVYQEGIINTEESGLDYFPGTIDGVVESGGKYDNFAPPIEGDSGGTDPAGIFISNGSTETIVVEDTGSNGANIHLKGNGAITPDKYIRAKDGLFQIVNHSYAAVILSLTDSGSLSIPGVYSGDGSGLTNLTVGNIVGTLPIAKGGTDAATALQARINLDTINATNLTTGTVNDARLPTTMSGKTFSGAISSSAAAPQITLSESDQPTGGKRTAFNMVGGTWFLQEQDDAGVGTRNVMTVARGGGITFIAAVTAPSFVGDGSALTGLNAANVSGSFTGSVVSSAATPQFALIETDQAVDAKRVGINMSGGAFIIQEQNDAGTGLRNVLNITRGGVATWATTMRVNGNVGLNIAPAASTNFSNRLDLTGGTNAVGYSSQQVVQSDVTASASLYSTFPSTVAASFTLSGLNHYFAEQGTIGAGSTVTNQTGFYARASLIGATNNYGFRGSIPSAANRWNVYMDGTANNAFAGNTRFGGLTAPTVPVDITGSITWTGTATGNGSAITNLNGSNVSSGTVPAARVDLTGVLPTNSYQGGFKNKIQNGKMLLAQRGTSVVVTSLAGPIPLIDRWIAANSTTGGLTMTQSVESPIVGSQFFNALRLTVTAPDTSIGAGEYVVVAQVIEGYNIQDLVGNNFTMSFWARSPKTGTHCVSLSSSNGDRSYLFEYTVNAANTWEYKTHTVAGGLVNTGVGWNYVNGPGLLVRFCFACGTTFHGTAGIWNTNNAQATAAQVNCMDTNGVVFGITGVQIEKGNVATPFEHLEYEAELFRCSRYLTITEGTFAGIAISATGGEVSLPGFTPFRIAPTLTTLLNGIWVNGLGAAASTGMTLLNPYSTGPSRASFTTAGGLVAGQSVLLVGQKVMLSAEL